jgi:RimJ/RimL family protein N-acetyltransferase
MFDWSTVPTLSTPRLDLVRWTTADADDLLRLCGDPRVMRFATDPPLTSRRGALRMLASMRQLLQTRQSIEWGLRLRRSGRIIGSCGLHSFSPNRSLAEVGCLLARRYWGRGLMREALSAMFVFGIDQLSLRLLLADIDEDNLASQQLFASLGFEPIGFQLHALPLRVASTTKPRSRA